MIDHKPRLFHWLALLSAVMVLSGCGTAANYNPETSANASVAGSNESMTSVSGNITLAASDEDASKPSSTTSATSSVASVSAAVTNEPATLASSPVADEKAPQSAVAVPPPPVPASNSVTVVPPPQVPASNAVTVVPSAPVPATNSVTVVPGSAASNPVPSSLTADRSLTVSWNAPTENTNGSALTNLIGYDIYYGTSPRTMTNRISIASLGIQTYVVNDLTSGTWYFTVVAVSAAGIVSNPSTVMHVTI